MLKAIRKRLGLGDLHAADHSVWEGWEVHGWPVTTVLPADGPRHRGRLMFRVGCDVLEIECMFGEY